MRDGVRERPRVVTRSRVDASRFVPGSSMHSSAAPDRTPRHLTGTRLAGSTPAGFTLPEMLIVIVMISVLALLAIPRFSAANGRRHMESARMRVAAALATARQAAIQKGETVEFKLSQNRVTVYTVKAPSDTLI